MPPSLTSVTWCVKCTELKESIEYGNEVCKNCQNDKDKGLKQAKKKIAKEIFDEIDRLLENQEVVTENQRCKEVGDWILHDYLPKQVAKLKKKYTEE